METVGCPGYKEVMNHLSEAEWSVKTGSLPLSDYGTWNSQRKHLCVFSEARKFEALDYVQYYYYY